MEEWLNRVQPLYSKHLVAQILLFAQMRLVYLLDVVYMVFGGH